MAAALSCRRIGLLRCRSETHQHLSSKLQGRRDRALTACPVLDSLSGGLDVLGGENHRRHVFLRRVLVSDDDVDDRDENARQRHRDDHREPAEHNSHERHGDKDDEGGQLPS
jgi:hypothetical protein